MNDNQLNSKRMTRRDALRTGSFTLAGVATLGGVRDALAQQTLPTTAATAPPPAATPVRPAAPRDERSLSPGMPGHDYTPVFTPGGATLPFKIVDGVKVFHLVVEEVDHEFAPGLRCTTWGYNGRTHGPTIEAVEGDRVRIYVTNTLPTMTTVHWHGVILQSGMDGVGGVSQRAIHQGETFQYEFTLRQRGTCMYHAHHDEMTQIGMGLMGMFIIHPRPSESDATMLQTEFGDRPRPDREFAIMLSEWAVHPGTSRPDTNVMSDFNILTMNGKVFPATAPLVVKKGQRIRLRFGNLSAMDHHPIHLHGYAFKLVATDGGDIQPSAQHSETTVLVPVGSTRDVEFVAEYEGDWVMHCHMTHHVMNQMGHGTPNMVGMNAEGLDEKARSLVPAYMTMGQDGMAEMGAMGMAVPRNSIPMVGGYGPFDYITMGGMFTILKVRAELSDDVLAGNTDPGWFENPPGTVATLATDDALQRDGIDVTPAGLIALRVGGDDRGQTAVYAQNQNEPTPAAVDRRLASVGSAHARSATSAPATVYACPMHPEVQAESPVRCPKCEMKLVVKR